MISLIVAKSQNDIIGSSNQIPWHLPEDLKRFKNLTTNTSVIMGRKTYDSIGKPLPNRLNIVISRNPDNSNTDILMVNSLDDALLKAPKDKQVFIIGGGQIYKEAIDKNIADVIHVTDVLIDIDGDTVFPKIPSNYSIVEESEVLVSTKNGTKYIYRTYQKN